MKAEVSYETSQKYVRCIYICRPYTDRPCCIGPGPTASAGKHDWNGHRRRNCSGPLSQPDPAGHRCRKERSVGFCPDDDHGSDGHFTVSNLPAGVYSVDVVASGFAADSRTGLKLASGTTFTLPISMHVASVSQSITVEAAVTLAVEAAPSQSSLEAKSAESVISSTYIRNFISATGDYSDVLQMSPGTFSVSPNGPGLGDTKTFFRGFKDGIYNMTFDGIPFNDTNDPTHHSWVWFPTPFIGSTVFDRSPGDATSIGPSNAGGSINLLSREATVDQDIQGTISYGSFNTRMLSLDYDSGLFGGKNKKSNLC